MGSSAVDIDFKMPDLAGKFRSHTRELYLFIAAQIQTNRGFLFAHEGAYNGHKKWAPLKFRQGQILSKSGTLRKSISPLPARGSPGNDGIVKISGDRITVGTRLYYARLMNDGTSKMPGGVLRPIKAKALMIPIPGGKTATPLAKQIGKTAHKNDNGGKFIFRKSVKIPPRPFDDWNREDQLELDEALSNKIAEILNR